MTDWQIVVRLRQWMLSRGVSAETDSLIPEVLKHEWELAQQRSSADAERITALERENERVVGLVICRECLAANNLMKREAAAFDAMCEKGWQLLRSNSGNWEVIGDAGRSDALCILGTGPTALEAVEDALSKEGGKAKERQRRMDAEGITEQDIYETRPPKQAEE